MPMLEAFPGCLACRHKPDFLDTISFFTIGYEQSESFVFLELLKEHKIEIVVDVRFTPLSRKKGFSKNQLQSLLEQAEIEYIHAQRLGAPKEIRDRLYENGSWYQYVKSYEKILQDRLVEIDDLIQLAKRKNICLLCFERDSQQCHRSLIAREMIKRGNDSNFEVHHIQY